MSQESRSPSPPHKQQASLRPLIVALSDLLGASILGAWALILGPLGFLRGTLWLGHVFWYVWILSPQGLLSRLVHAAIDWRLGNFDAAVFQLEFLCSRVEHYLGRHPKYLHARWVLEDFYTLLARAYLHSGHVDDAMSVILRAKKFLGADRLPHLARLDAKTAHLVRAGLAAGKLLDGGGLAALFVKSQTDQPVAQQTGPQTSSKRPPPPPPRRQGATVKDSANLGKFPQTTPQRHSDGARVIVFPKKPTTEGSPEEKGHPPTP